MAESFALNRYLSAHWQGRQPLFWSFWINLVAIRVLVFALQNLLAPLEDQDHHQWRLAVYTAAFLFHVVLLCWQVVGVVRAADRHFGENGNMALVWGAQLGATLTVILSAVYLLGAIQMTQRRNEVDVIPEIATLTQPTNASISVSLSGDSLLIDGDIEPGMTRRVERYLLDHASVTQVHLNSNGGNIFEARGLYRLFFTKSLNTHVDNLCASACTTAYVGGVRRTAGNGARFGFHQYRMDLSRAVIVTSAADEQRVDETLFLEAGASAAFVSRMFDTRAEQMWWPSVDYLRTHGVVHGTR